MPVPAAIATRSRKLAPGVIIELFALDVSMITSRFTGLPGDIYAFHNSNDNGTSPITFQGIDYFGFPIATSGFEITSEGKQPRPQLSFSNVTAFGSALLREYNDLAGAKLSRIQTLFEYLDGQPGADATQEMPRHIFYVDRKVVESKAVITLEMTSRIDIEGVKLPRRQLTANACVWRYRSGDGCDYAGGPVTDEDGNDLIVLNPRGLWDKDTAYVTGDGVYVVLNGVQSHYVAKAASAAGLYPRFNPEIWAGDVCRKTLGACRKRFGINAVLPFGGFPAILRAPLTST